MVISFSTPSSALVVDPDGPGGEEEIVINWDSIIQMLKRLAGAYKVLRQPGVGQLPDGASINITTGSNGETYWPMRDMPAYIVQNGPSWIINFTINDGFSDSSQTLYVSWRIYDNDGGGVEIKIRVNAQGTADSNLGTNEGLYMWYLVSSSY